MTAKKLLAVGLLLFVAVSIGVAITKEIARHQTTAVAEPSSEPGRERAARAGIPGALLLGVLFALSFCPISAALFFGSLVPLAVEHQSAVALPTLYGVGTGLPVLVIAIPLALGAGAVGRLLERLSSFERWARRITGVVFIAIGVYYSIAFIFLA